MPKRKPLRVSYEEHARMTLNPKLFLLMIRRATHCLYYLALSLSIMPSALVWGEEPTSIQQILEAPKIYHLRHVTVRGTVRDVQPLAPYTLANGDPCYGAYLFRLEEDESTLSMAVLGICGRPVVRDPEVEDGDRVEVSVTIQAPSHGGMVLSFKGPKAVTDEEAVVQAVVDRILPIVE
ncbi:hypothetical protein [Candidatus Nitrospira nitrosa]|nr:hypothetical protein [Candidatus Nitrospira nitrosa]